MTNEQILKKAIEKAQYQGYSLPFKWIDYPYINWLDKEKIELTENNYYAIIFDQSFARTFWGDRLMTQEDIIKNDEFLLSKDCPEYVWQYYLQQMVLEKEPLKYLERFL